MAEIEDFPLLDLSKEVDFSILSLLLSKNRDIDMQIPHQIPHTHTHKSRKNDYGLTYTKELLKYASP